MKKHYYLLFIFSFIIVSCSQIRKAADVITKPTAREVYERDFEDENPDFIKWQLAYNGGLADSLKIELPFVENGIFSSENFPIYSFDFEVKEGEKLFIEVKRSIDSTAVFIDLFQVKNDSIKPLEKLLSNEPKTTSVSYSVKENSFYKLIVQPQINLEIPFVLKIYTQPSYAFPVSGANNSNIQSFWGAQRAGGKRSHEGNDIFAARGTPVIAVTDGRVSSTGNRGLGGKQVWLRDGLLGKSLYYAHLDSIAVSTGKSVKIGDTLGFVGNTGNAKTTAPHLHFGIYKGYQGAIDPLPFIEMRAVPSEGIPIGARFGITKNNANEIRIGPDKKFLQVANLKMNDTISIFGKSGNWYQVSVSDTLRGFLNERSLKEIPLN